MHVHITYTGGTIGMVDSPHGLVPGADLEGWLDSLLKGTPLARSVSVTSLEPLIDSSNATPLRRPEVAALSAPVTFAAASVPSFPRGSWEPVTTTGTLRSVSA